MIGMDLGVLNRRRGLRMLPARGLIFRPLAAALEAKQRAEHALKDRSAQIDYARAMAEYAEAAAQLQAIQRLRKRAGHG
jgi:hypothetical protein